VLERKEFSFYLDLEASNAGKFYIENLLVNIRKLIEEKNCDQASVELLNTLAFCCTNIITFRQLLIRYDAFRRTFDGMPLTEWFIQQSIFGRSHPVHALFTLDGLKDMENIIIGQMHEKGLSSTDFTSQIEQFLHLLEKTNRSMEKAVAGHLVWKDRILMSLRQYFLFGFQSRGIMNEPKIFMSMRGRHFKKEIAKIEKWRAKGEFLPDSNEDEVDHTSLSQKIKLLKPENRFPLFLNLLSCFLFMMNNYIIEPSSAYYAEALGSSDALSGIMVGAAPWFAIASAIVYSYWTNHNYKQPILLAGILQFIGNLMYSSAYSYKSIEMCLIGRAITGLGAPRVINRRYVADATPFELRTVASASFGLATALGAALGPGMAIILDRIEFEFYIPLVGEHYFNGMTGPGYFMALNWFIFTITILLTFSEPTRSGLDELKQREDVMESPSSKRNALLENNSTSYEGTACDANILDDAVVCLKSTDTLPTTSQNDSEDDCSVSSDTEDDKLTNSGATSKISASCNPSYHCCSCMSHITKPVVICMTLIFAQRFALESIVGSTSIITKNRYGWRIKNVGTLHLVNGLIVIPVSLLSGYLSTFYEDRFMALCFLVIALGGMTILFDPTDLVNQENYSYNSDDLLSTNSVEYIIGSLISFSGIEACESFVASLISKVIPSALAQGTFNAGLLETLVGTGGRATGDVFITLMGLRSIRGLLNLLIIPGAVLIGTSVLLVLANYEILAV